MATPTTAMGDARDTVLAPGLIRHLTAMVEMRDGVRLATDIFVPTTGAPRGTIVERTPYGRKPASFLATRDSYYRFIEHFALSGCVVVMQDCRGTGDSEGEFVKYVNEANDGIDTFAWISQQEWWAGELYLTGRSYSAHAALAAVVAGASAVRGIFLDCGGFWSAYHEGIRQGGSFEIKQATWAFEAAKRRARESGDELTLAALESQNLKDWIRPIAWQHGQSPLRFLSEDESALLDLWDRDGYDEYWQQPSLSARGAAARLGSFPSLHISGWYDLYTLSTVRLFQEMGDREGADAYLIIGPWTHCALDEATAGDVDFGDLATMQGAAGTDYLGLRTAWFSYCAGGPEFGPRVRFFMMGGGSGRRVRGRLDHGGEWLQADSWPPRGTEDLELWLGARGELSDTPDARVSTLRYAYDPHDPVPTIGGSVGSYTGILSPGAFDQTEDARVYGVKPPYLPLIARPDVLSFSTPALERDVAVAGEIQLWMDFSTTAADTDITLKLVDVAPPTETHAEGFAMNVADTIVRLRHHEERELLGQTESGERIHRVRISLPPTANRFAAGHRLRIDISSSNFPRFDVNTNDVLAPRSRFGTTAINGVRVGGADGARLTIPVMTEEAIAAARFAPRRERPVEILSAES